MSNPNDHIIEKLTEAIKEHYSDKPEIINFIDGALKIDSRLIVDFIINLFPYPISEELRRLVSGDRRERNRERVEQVLRVAERTTQFFAYVMLVQLWSESKKAPLNLSADFRYQFKELDRPGFGVFAGLVRAIYNLFEEYDITPFTLYNKSPSFNKKKFFSSLNELIEQRNALSHHFQESDCLYIENLLKELLYNLSFFAKFKLVTVSRIEVFKSRLTDTRYKHSMRILAKHFEHSEREERDYPDFFSDSHAILLFRDFESPKDYLNLSPFVIDTSCMLSKGITIEGVRNGIYVYNSMNNDKYFYYFTDGSEQTAINCLPTFDQIKHEFQDLKTSLGDEKPV